MLESERSWGEVSRALFTSIRWLVASIRVARGDLWASTLKLARNVQLNPSSVLLDWLWRNGSDNGIWNTWD